MMHNSIWKQQPLIPLAPETILIRNDKKQYFISGSSFNGNKSGWIDKAEDATRYIHQGDLKNVINKLECEYNLIKFHLKKCIHCGSYFRMLPLHLYESEFGWKMYSDKFCSGTCCWFHSKKDQVKKNKLWVGQIFKYGIRTLEVIEIIRKKKVVIFSEGENRLEMSGSEWDKFMKLWKKGKAELIGNRKNES